MVRRLLNWTLVLIAVMGLAGIGIVGTVWFFPGVVLRFALPPIEKSIGMDLDFAAFSGDPWHGWVMKNISFRYPGVSATVGTLRIKLDWRGIWNKKLIFDHIEVDHPRVTLHPQDFPKKTGPDSAQGPSGPEWIVAANQILMIEGRLHLIDKNPWTPEFISEIQLKAHYEPGLVEIRQFSADTMDHAIRIQGDTKLSPLRPDLTVAITGPNVEGNAAMQNHAWEAFFNLKNIDVPDNFIKKQPDLGRLNGSVSARGRGWTQEQLKGHVKLNLDTTRDYHLTFTGGVENNHVDYATRLRGPGVSATSHGDVDISRRTMDVHVNARSDKAFIAQFLEQGGADLEVMADLSGPFTHPGGRIQGTVGQIQMGGFQAEKLEFSAKGDLKDHTIKINLQRNGQRIDAEAAGAYSGGEWRAQWPFFQTQWPDLWTSTQPFTTVVAPGRVRVSGLNLTHDTALLSADVVLKDSVFEKLDVTLRDLNASVISDAGLTRVPISGMIRLYLNLHGPMSHPEGQFSFLVTDAAIDSQMVGGLSGKGEIVDDRIHLEKLDIDTPSGTIHASADLPLGLKGKKIPPFTATLRATHFDPSGFVRLVPNMELSSANLDANITITGKNNTLSAEGPLVLTAESLRLPDKGIDLKNISIDMRAQGEQLEVRKGEIYSSKGGKISIGGQVAIQRLGLTLQADNFKFDVPIGLSGELDADLALRGRWNQPELTGKIQIIEADYTAANKKKEDGKKDEKKAEPKNHSPETPSPFAMNVEIEFYRNVWYKQGQSAIELRGHLTAKKEPQLELQLFGTIQVVQGTYIFYGRAFEIEEGRITFLGRPEMNPDLYIVATYVSDISNIKVHLTFSGTLKEPTLQLSSEPPMEEMDIISVLVTGAPLSSREEGGNRDSEAFAKTLAANYLAEKLRSRLQSDLDIDVFQFKFTETGETALSIGKNVTQDLYVSYNHTLGQEGNRQVEAEYELSKYWSLEGYSTFLGRYVIDLLFRYGIR